MGTPGHKLIILPEAYQARSVSVSFYHVVEKLRGEDSCVLTNELSSVFSTIFVITRTIFLRLKVTNFNGHLWYPPL